MVAYGRKSGLGLTGKQYVGSLGDDGTVLHFGVGVGYMIKNI